MAASPPMSSSRWPGSWDFTWQWSPRCCGPEEAPVHGKTRRQRPEHTPPHPHVTSQSQVLVLGWDQAGRDPSQDLYPSSARPGSWRLAPKGPEGLRLLHLADASPGDLMPSLEGRRPRRTEELVPPAQAGHLYTRSAKPAELQFTRDSQMLGPTLFHPWNLVYCSAQTASQNVPRGHHQESVRLDDAGPSTVSWRDPQKASIPFPGSLESRFSSGEMSERSLQKSQVSAPRKVAEVNKDEACWW